MQNQCASAQTHGGLILTDIVFSIQISELLKKLRAGEWMVPEFQREFVWDIPSITALAISVIESKPIGMATIWEQEDNSVLPLHHISLKDHDEIKKETGKVYYGEDSAKPNKFYAILDGRQRSTALAIAFGGFRPKSGSYKYAGRFFIDIKTDDEDDRIQYIKETDLMRKQITSDAAAITRGLFPLCSFTSGQDMHTQWIEYIQAVANPAYYEGGVLPGAEEISRRNEILKKAHKGIFATELAVYKVPSNYDLSAICDIFETLNTTGTVVSKVDLIHSWLYSDTQGGTGEPILLREWMARFGDMSGAIGWSVPDKRPELVAQMATACHVASEKKYDPRLLRGSKSQPISSLKSGDLLATPTKHWSDFIHREVEVAGYLEDFQKVVADGYFPYMQCPYPISACIYVALRWHKAFDDEVHHSGWKVSHLNALFRAFFWRNALSGRYDQGFLTQIGADILKLKEFLNDVSSAQSDHHWALDAGKKLEQYMDRQLETRDQFISRLTNGRPGGAFQAAIVLSMKPRIRKDFISGSSMEYPGQANIDLHHIYPKDWCRNNFTADVKAELDPSNSGRDWIDSMANLMPLTAASNISWSAKSPATFLEERSITYSTVEAALKPAMIDREAFEMLRAKTQNPKPFWERRAGLIVDNLFDLTNIKL